jgi:hypothetical protein
MFGYSRSQILAASVPSEKDEIGFAPSINKASEQIRIEVSPAAIVNP